MGPTLFLSDLHLAQGRDAETAAFRAFVRGPARRAAAVYILGDLFDAWIGDDQVRERYYRDIADALKGVTNAGVPLYFAHGNRDFMVGDAFLRSIGASLLAEQTVIEVDGRRALVSHGDELCTDDVGYQRFKRRSRSADWKRRMLRLPYLLRGGLALYYRLGSRVLTRHKSAMIMDVNAQAVADAFRRFDVDLMIHGHTHRPARHHYTIDGVPRERIVLADWVGGGHYLEAKEGRLEPHDVSPASA